MTSPDTENEVNSVLLIGGPDAGKSNFLFRLWIAIDEGKGLLKKDGLPDQLEYLRTGAERLLEGEFAAHTSKEVYERISVPLICDQGNGGAKGLLVVPDVPGEQVLTICQDRQWSQSWEDLISSRCACLLFIRAGSDEIVAPLDWAACYETYGAAPRPPDRAQNELQSPLEQVRPDDQSGARNHVELPTQVILVEWLQFLRRAFTELVGGKFRPRIGIVIAAWDAVPEEQKSVGPMTYLKNNFPLLYQYVLANDDIFDFQAFGLSVVSGDLSNDPDFKREYLSGRPGDFGAVVHALTGTTQETKDITHPVAWALRFV